MTNPNQENTFDPSNWMLPGSSYFREETQTSDSKDEETSGQEYRVYFSRSGLQVSILFIDGEPQQPIPQGFYPAGHARLVEDSAAEEREKEGKDQEIDPEDNFYIMDETSLGVIGSQKGAGLLDIFGGGLIGDLIEAGRVTKMKAALTVAKERGLTTAQEALEKRLEEAGAGGGDSPPDKKPPISLSSVLTNGLIPTVLGGGLSALAKSGTGNSIVERHKNAVAKYEQGEGGGPVRLERNRRRAGENGGSSFREEDDGGNFNDSGKSSQSSRTQTSQSSSNTTSSTGYGGSSGVGYGGGKGGQTTGGGSGGKGGQGGGFGGNGKKDEEKKSPKGGHPGLVI